MLKSRYSNVSNAVIAMAVLTVSEHLTFPFDFIKEILSSLNTKKTVEKLQLVYVKFNMPEKKITLRLTLQFAWFSA